MFCLKTARSCGGAVKSQCWCFVPTRISKVVVMGESWAGLRAQNSRLKCAFHIYRTPCIAPVGACDGEDVGDAVVGAAVGASVGAALGADVGSVVGDALGE